MSMRIWGVIGFLCVIVSLTIGIKSQQPTANSGVEDSDLATVGGNPQFNPFAQTPMSPVDRSVPQFSLASLDGTQWTEESLEGKPWIINFWATWCPPCVEELPSMNEAYKYVEPKGVGMLAINVAEGAQAVENFLQRVPIEFPNVLGTNDTMLNWSALVLPTTIVVDAKGNVVFEAQGERKWDDADLLQPVIDLL